MISSWSRLNTSDEAAPVSAAGTVEEEEIEEEEADLAHYVEELEEDAAFEELEEETHAAGEITTTITTTTTSIRRMRLRLLRMLLRSMQCHFLESPFLRRKLTSQLQMKSMKKLKTKPSSTKHKPKRKPH